LIDHYAASGNPTRFNFPKPQIEGLNFSFSGLKTSILYFLEHAGKTFSYKPELKVSQIEKEHFIQTNLNDLCASIQHRIITILLEKLKRAADETGIKSICLAGGVSANKGLRQSFNELALVEGWQPYIPSFEYCTDNAAMIAITAYHKFLVKDFTPLSQTSSARANW
jgi:N6-L-threonylcarbamoyladenine synthase